MYYGRPYAARVPESAHVGGLLLPVGTITITDEDGGVNADVHVECVPASRDDDVCNTFNVSTEKVFFHILYFKLIDYTAFYVHSSVVYSMFII